MITRTFPIAIEPGTETQAFGASVPDLPGCFSAGDTLEQAIHQTREAIEGHLAVLMEDGVPIPAGRPVSEHLADVRYANCIWGVVEVGDVPPTTLDADVAATLTEEFLRDVDLHARAEKLTRSEYMTLTLAKAMGR